MNYSSGIVPASGGCHLSGPSKLLALYFLNWERLVRASHRKNIRAKRVAREYQERINRNQKESEKDAVSMVVERAVKVS